MSAFHTTLRHSWLITGYRFIIQQIWHIFTEKFPLEQVCHRLELIAWVYHRVLKLSRTIAELAGAPDITQVHLAEALQYWPKVDVM